MKRELFSSHGSLWAHIVFTALFLLLSGAAPDPLHAQGLSSQIALNPQKPAAGDEITFTLSGVWRDGCVPQSPKVLIEQAVVRIETSNPGIICTQSLMPWSLAGSIGRLPAGNYDLVAVHYAQGATASVDILRTSFVVEPASSSREVIFPIVVNGASAEKLHYQTIFTVLNTTAENLGATLQVYGNNGAPGGVFCSPLAPPPSKMTVSLDPNAEYLQFTSPDLLFHDGWASLRWQGSAPILASTEITLVSAPPAPCLLVCNRPSSEKLSSTQVAAIAPALAFRLPVTLNSYRQTALALVNPSSTEPLTVKVTIHAASGENAKLGVPSNFEIRIRPLERISRLLWQMALGQSAPTLIVPSRETFQGSVVLASSSPFAAAGLNIMFPEGKLVSIPIQ